MPVVKPIENFKNTLSITTGGRFGTETIFISLDSLRNTQI